MAFACRVGCAFPAPPAVGRTGERLRHSLRQRPVRLTHGAEASADLG